MKYRRALFLVTYSKVKGKIEYLILKRTLHWSGWEFPKGGRRFYESARMTVRREIKEETGLRVKGIKEFDLSGKYKYDKEYDDRKGFVGQTYKLFAVEVEKRGVVLDRREHADFEWVSFAKAMKKLHWDTQKKSLKVVNEWLGHGKV